MAQKTKNKTNSLLQKYKRLCDDDKKLFVNLCAKEWGIKERQVRNIINGKSTLTAEQLLTVCDLLECKPNELLDRQRIKPLSYHSEDQDSTILASKVLNKHFQHGQPA